MGQHKKNSIIIGASGFQQQAMTPDQAMTPEQLNNRTSNASMTMRFPRVYHFP